MSSKRSDDTDPADHRRHLAPDKFLPASSCSDIEPTGQHAAVWAEMTGCGAALRDDVDGWSEAKAVTTATTDRARVNVERRIEELTAAGYRFTPGDGLPTYEPPAADITDQLDDLEAEIGVLPLALRGWYERVGRVNLVGDHPDWTFGYPDPLVIDAPPEDVRSWYGEWAEDRDAGYDSGLFTIDLAPELSTVSCRKSGTKPRW